MDETKIVLNFDDVMETMYESLILMGYAPKESDAELFASLVIAYTSELLNIAVEHILGDEPYEEPTPNEINDLERLYEELQKQEAIAYGLKKRISALKGELKHERQEKDKLLKELREKRKKEHYRNGQKRGSHGRNG